MRASDVALEPVCQECGTVWLAAGDRRWRACRVDEPGTDETPAIGFWCPECVSREFSAGT